MNFLLHKDAVSRSKRNRGESVIWTRESDHHFFLHLKETL
jgi:hypothetical protein